MAVSVAVCRPAISCRTPVSRVESACGQGAGNGYCQGGNRPRSAVSCARADRTSPTAGSHRAPLASRRTIPAWNRRPDRTAAPVFLTGNAGTKRPGDRPAGCRAALSMSVSRAVGTRSCPGKNGVAPGGQDGTGKTGPSDRRRDLPDPIRRTGAGLPCAGHGVSGHGDIRRQPPGLRTAGRTGARPVARRFFCRWPCRTSRRFFTAGIPRIPARTLLRFPRAFQRAFRFGRKGISFQISVGKILRNDNKRMAEAKIRNETKCKKTATQKLGSAANDTHEPPPPGRTRDFRRAGAAPGGSQHAVPSVPGGAPLPVICKPFRKNLYPPTPPSGKAAL